MWNHYCPVEKSLMAVGKGEECNWCGAKEKQDDTKEADASETME